MTDWGSYFFADMYKAVHQQDASRQRTSAGGWRTLASQLDALGGNLRHYRDQVAPDWHSKGGQAFREKMTQVMTTLEAYADEVRIYATILDDTADAVEKAQERMNQLNSRRAAYIGNREDWQDFGDPDGGFGADVVDVGSDLWHNRPEFLGGDGFVDPAEMRKYDAEARTIMYDLSGKYETANRKRQDLPAYQGPILANLLQVPGGGNVPGAPNIPAPPAPPVAPPVPKLPPGTNPPPVPVPPTVPTPPGVPPGPSPELVGTPAPPAPPVVSPPVVPAPPGAPGLPGAPIPPLVPGLNLPGQNNLGGGGGGARINPPTVPNAPGKGGRPGPGVPPPPGRNAMKKSGVIGQRPGTGPGKPALPPSAGTGKGVIGKRPGDPSQRGGQPPAAGQQRRPGQQATPPPSQRGRGATPPRAGNGTGRGATPPPTGQRPGVIGRRPGADEQGRHGTPPPAQRRDRRNVENQPIGPDGTPGTIGPTNTAWGTPPPTIGNTSRPNRPTTVDHDAIGGRPQGGPVRRQQPGADGPEFNRQRGVAARDAAPPVLGRERPAQPQQVEPPAARRSQRSTAPIDEDYGVAEAETAAPVIQTPERHERDERGPAIGAG